MNQKLSHSTNNGHSTDSGPAMTTARTTAMTTADVTIAELRDELQAEKRANHQPIA